MTVPICFLGHREDVETSTDPLGGWLHRAVRGRSHVPRVPGLERRRRGLSQQRSHAVPRPESCRRRDVLGMQGPMPCRRGRRCMRRGRTRTVACGTRRMPRLVKWPREATMSCCRRSAFSAISSAGERVTSAMKPLATPEGRHALRSPRIARAARLATVARSPEPSARNTVRSRADPKAIIKACSSQDPGRSCGGGGK